MVVSENRSCVSNPDAFMEFKNAIPFYASAAKELDMKLVNKVLITLFLQCYIIFCQKFRDKKE